MLGSCGIFFLKRILNFDGKGVLMLYSFGVRGDGSKNFEWNLKDGKYGVSPASLLLGNAGLIPSPYSWVLGCLKSSLLGLNVSDSPKEPKLDVDGFPRYELFLEATVHGKDYVVTIHVEDAVIVHVALVIDGESHDWAAMRESGGLQAFIDWVYRWKVLVGLDVVDRRFHFDGMSCEDALNVSKSNNLLKAIPCFDSLSIVEGVLEVNYRDTEGYKWSVPIHQVPVCDFGILIAEWVCYSLVKGYVSVCYWDDFSRLLPLRVHEPLTRWLLTVVEGVAEETQGQVLLESDSEKVLGVFDVWNTFISLRNRVTRLDATVHSDKVDAITGRVLFA